MCIIVAKPAGIAMPNDSIIENCFWGNPDGAGYMVANGKTVTIRKGFMQLDDLYQALAAEGDLTEYSVVMHFRIKTHGKVQPSCCHPFPVTSDHSRLSATYETDRIGVAHNGIIQSMTSKTSEGTSDTMAYIAEVIAPMRRLSEDFMHNSNALDIFEATVGSRLCFLDNSGDIVTIGEFINDGGILYSNTSYTRNISNWNSYGDIWRGGYDSFLWNDLDDDELMDNAVESLPYLVCEDCPNKYACAYGLPECMSYKEASQTVDELVVEWGW